MLHDETVDDNTLDLLRQLQRNPSLQETRLVGGTALALQIGHRKSIDLTFLLDRFTLQDMLELYIQKFDDGSVFTVLKSLVFFDDAEADPMPNMLKPVDWIAAKQRVAGAVSACQTCMLEPTPSKIRENRACPP